MQSSNKRSEIKVDKKELAWKFTKRQQHRKSRTRQAVKAARKAYRRKTREMLKKGLEPEARTRVYI